MKKLKDMKLNGAKVSDLRVEKGCTLEDVAKAVGCDVSSVSLWENGERQPGPKFLKKIGEFFGVPVRSILVGLILLVTASPAISGQNGMDREETIAHMTPYWDEIVDAIYLAEGGAKAKKPFGILSVECSDYADCRKVCFNTVRNNWFRWEKAGRPGEYLEFLARRYCPVGAANDPRGLNRNWLGNVQGIIERS